MKTLSWTRSCFAAAVAASVSPLLAQNARLSVLSSWQPDTLFHVGVTTPDKSFTTCRLFASFGGPAVAGSLQGVPVVVDPATMLELPIWSQYGAGPTSTLSTEAKWRFDIRLPAALPPGVPLHVQAILLDAAGNFQLTNGVAGQVAPQGVHEVRYTLSHSTVSTSSYPYGSFTIRGYDIDAGAYVVGHSFPKPNGASGFDYLEVSPDRRRCVLRFSNGHACAVELATLAATWLPQPPAGHARSRPRFRPGVSDQVWFAESYVNWTWSLPGGTSRKDYDCNLVAFDLTAGSTAYGTMVASHAIDADTGPVATGYTTLHPDWSFDPSGSYACFVRMQSWNNGSPVASWFTRYPIGTTTPADSLLGYWSAPWANPIMRPAVNGSTVCFSYPSTSAGGWSVRAADAASVGLGPAVPIGGWPTPRGACDGASLWAGGGSSPLLVLGCDPVTGPLGLLTSPYGSWQRYAGVTDNGGGAVLAGTPDYGASPVVRIHVDAMGQVRQERVYCSLAPWNGVGGGSDPERLGAIDGSQVQPDHGRSNAVTLAHRHGLLVKAVNVELANQNPSSADGLALIDTETMTFVSLQPDQTPHYARALPASNTWISLLF